MTRLRLIPVLAAATLLVSGCAAPASAPDTWPLSIAALGHSGLTGYNSDPDKPGQDAKTNSWATGTNPDVNSVYLRALDQSPALEGHFLNAAVSGSNVDDLPAQVEVALQQEPVPDLFIIQSVDNDQRCDGTDDANIPVYGQKMTAVLQSIVDGAPGAKIWVTGTPVTWQNYTDALAAQPDMVAANSGDGICDAFDLQGNERPEALEAGQQITDAYGDALRAACAGFPDCTFGGDEMRAMEVTNDDLAPDGSHFAISGQNKMAAIAWATVGGLG
jgi:hypothetical protein